MGTQQVYIVIIGVGEGILWLALTVHLTQPRITCEDDSRSTLGCNHVYRGKIQLVSWYGKTHPTHSVGISSRTARQMHLTQEHTLCSSDVSNFGGSRVKLWRGRTEQKLERVDSFSLYPGPRWAMTSFFKLLPWLPYCDWLEPGMSILSEQQTSGTWHILFSGP